jgi:hypothetical protein
MNNMLCESNAMWKTSINRLYEHPESKVSRFEAEKSILGSKNPSSVERTTSDFGMH